jgi:uncharacterized membrane protein YoaK (UPF0700 family)
VEIESSALGGKSSHTGVNLDTQAVARDINFDPAARKSVVLRNRLLIVLSFSAGIVDMISFLALGKVFTAFQTGNLVFLGLGIIGRGPQGIILPNTVWVISSFLLFGVGAMVSARIVRPEESKTTAWPKRVTAALAVTALAQAAFLVGWIATSGHPTAAAGATLAGIMGFGMGVQIHAARSLGVPDVSTTAATATWVTFVSDIATKSLRGNGRFLRLWSMIAMILGAAVGTYFIDNVRTAAPALPLIITLLTMVIAAGALKPKSS